MKKRSIAFLLVLSAVTFFAAVFVGLCLGSPGIGSDLEHVAYRRLDAMMHDHAAWINRGLNELYEPLKILADSVNLAEGPLFTEEWEQAAQLLLRQNYNMLCYADISGNTVKWQETPPRGIIW